MTNLEYTRETVLENKVTKECMLMSGTRYGNLLASMNFTIQEVNKRLMDAMVYEDPTSSKDILVKVINDEKNGEYVEKLREKKILFVRDLQGEVICFEKMLKKIEEVAKENGAEFVLVNERDKNAAYLQEEKVIKGYNIDRLYKNNGYMGEALLLKKI